MSMSVIIIESAALLSACTLGPPRYELDQSLEKGSGRVLDIIIN